MATTYTKLRDGSWGVRSTEKLASGQKVVVAKKSGETKTETVGKVLWSGDGITLASIATNSEPSGSSRRSGNVCADCGKGGPLVCDMEDGLMKHYRCCDMPPN